MITLICSKCKKELDVSCFYKRKDRKRGYASWCKNCCKQLCKNVIVRRSGTKVCTKCGIEKDVSCFYKSNNRSGGCMSRCIDCCKQYNKENRQRKAKYNRQYNIDNALSIAKQKKERRKIHPELVAAQKKKHYQLHRLQILEKDRQRLYKLALFETYSEQLEGFEVIRRSPENRDLLEVKCAYCGKWLRPTNVQVRNRMSAINTPLKGEQRFYCSENCKQACPIYNQRLWPKGFKQATSREVVPLLRQLVLERDSWTCQKCGATTETAQLHVHHIVPYRQNKMQANDPDSCMTLCKKCHKEVHQQEGCKYSDLKC